MSDDQHDPIEELLVEILDRPENEWAEAIESVCRSHPEHAATLRRRFDSLKASGLGLTEKSHDIPDRLGGFKLIEKLGGGGMGIVYLAEEVAVGRRVALKLVRPEQLYFQGARDRFKREIEATAKLTHPGIVPVYAYGEASGIPYFTMERVRGKSLAEMIERLQRANDPARMDADDIAVLFDDPPGQPGKVFGRSWTEFCIHAVRQAALALHYAHDKGILHRDVKPSNLMLTPDGRVRLLDFGLARSEDVARVTRSGSTIGSLPYMSPEQLRGVELDRRSDVYSLGVSLYELLTFHCPYLTNDNEETRRLILAGHADPLTDYNASVSWEVETVCLKAMDPEASARYATAEDFARDLANILELRPIEAKRPSAARRVRRWVQRHPTKTAVLALGTLFVVFGPLVLWLQARAHNARLEVENDRIWQIYDELILDSWLPKQDERAWPATPDRIVEMRKWLGEGERIAKRRPIYEAILATIRERALPYTDADRKADAEMRRRYEHNVRQASKGLAQLDAVDPNKPMTRTRRWYVNLIEESKREIADRYTWRFADVENDQWYHDSLVRILSKLDDLDQRVAAMKRRMAFASSVRKRTIDEHRAEWNTVIAEIADKTQNPIYDGLKLEPQLGLIPLGKDPQSGLYEFAHLQTGDPIKRSGPGARLAPRARHGLVFVLLPGGKVTIGARRPTDDDDERTPFTDENVIPNESPVTTLRLDPFLISKYEMTQAQWLRIADVNPSFHEPSFMRMLSGAKVSWLHPVENMSWTECRDTLARLGLELPSEAQWEYAARAGTKSPWYTGWTEDSLDGAANLFDTSIRLARQQAPDLTGLWGDRREFAPFGDAFSLHAAVGSFTPNRFGLYDVCGNVAEWCGDSLMSYRIAGRAGTGLREIETEPVVYRGGGFLDPPRLARSSYRGSTDRSNRSPRIGVRPVFRLH